MKTKKMSLIVQDKNGTLVIHDMKVEQDKQGRLIALNQNKFSKILAVIK